MVIEGIKVWKHWIRVRRSGHSAKIVRVSNPWWVKPLIIQYVDKMIWDLLTCIWDDIFETSKLKIGSQAQRTHYALGNCLTRVKLKALPVQNIVLQWCETIELVLANILPNSTNLLFVWWICSFPVTLAWPLTADRLKCKFCSLPWEWLFPTSNVSKYLMLDRLKLWPVSYWNIHIEIYSAKIHLDL